MRDEPFKSGYIALIGRPNVGKSTLLGQILQEKVAIVSPTPQTTRHRILGIRNLPSAQLIVIDTPGIHTPRHRLNERMVKTACDSLADADLILFLVEADSPPGFGDRHIITLLTQAARPVFLAVNKIDRVRKEALLPLIAEYAREYSWMEVIPLSALTGENVDHLLEVIVKYLPEGPRYYAEDVLTDQTVRSISAEIIREKILTRTREEIPYSVAVAIEEFKEVPEEHRVVISAVIYVEKESQKGILIGKKGEMLKAVGQEARREIEALVEANVYLSLWVKVKKDWRQNEVFLKELGY